MEVVVMITTYLLLLFEKNKKRKNTKKERGKAFLPVLNSSGRPIFDVYRCTES